MTQERFWEIVDELDYKSDLDYDRCAEYLFDTFSKEEISEFENIFSKFYIELEEEMDSQLEQKELDYSYVIGKSDDGLSDLLSHIIGIGKNYYDKSMNDVEYLGLHANGAFQSVEGYSESFSYIFNGVEK